MLNKIHLKRDMNIPKIEELDSPKKKGILYMRKHYPEFTKYLQERYPNVNKFNAAVYLYYRNMEHPQCPMCGAPTPFLDETRGFQKYCCYKCANASPEAMQKREQTNLKKYGTKTPAQSQEVKAKVIKTYTERHGGMGNASEQVKQKQHSTMMEQYGTAHALQNEEIKQKAIYTARKHGGVGLANPITRHKMMTTTQLQHGGIGLGSTEISQKIQATNRQKYGVDWASQAQDVIDKINESKRLRRIEEDKDIVNITIENGSTICEMKCPHSWCQRCGERTYKIPTGILYDRRRDSTELCTKLLPVRPSHIKDTSIELFVKHILDDNFIEYQQSNRELLNGQEIDFFIPSKNIAIECNGIYWHSTRVKDTKYHIKKFKQLQERGIQLISIWQDWVVTRPDILKSILLSKLGCTSTTIYARNTVIEEISSKECNQFLKENHLQGPTGSSVRLGLYNKVYITDQTSKLELVAVMTFGRRKTGQGNKNDTSWELSRFCCKLNTRVIGAASKLLTYFISHFNPSKIVSFSLNDISDGGLYKTLKFHKETSATSYWYVDRLYRRYHRSTFTKAAIKKHGWAPIGKWNEADVMYRRGYLQIYDSGTTKWTLEPGS